MPACACRAGRKPALAEAEPLTRENLPTSHASRWRNAGLRVKPAANENLALWRANK